MFVCTHEFECASAGTSSGALLSSFGRGGVQFRETPSSDFPLLHASKIPPSTTVRFHFLPHYTYSDAYSTNIAHLAEVYNILLARPGSWMPRGTDQFPRNPIAHAHPVAAAQLDDSGPPVGQSMLPQDENCSGGAQGTQQIGQNVKQGFQNSPDQNGIKHPCELDEGMFGSYGSENIHIKRPEVLTMTRVIHTTVSADSNYDLISQNLSI